MGRRPKRSDSRPHIGANKNCIAEKQASSRPMTAPTAFSEPCGISGAMYSLPVTGRMGNTMPKPSKSTTTTKKTISIAFMLDGAGDDDVVVSGEAVGGLEAI